MRSPFVVIGAAIMAFTVDKSLACTFLWVIPLLSVIVILIMKVTIPMYRSAQKALDTILSRVRENLRGVRVLRAFSLENDEKKAFHAETEHLKSIQTSSGRISALLNPLTYAIVNIAIAVILLEGRRRYDISLVEAGAIVAVVNYMSQVLVELIKLANLIVTISRAIASAKRIESVWCLQTVESKIDRAKKGVRTVLLMGAVSTFVIEAGYFAVGEFGLMLFTTDSEVLSIGVSMMRYIVPWYITYIAIELLSGAIRGAGKSLIPTLISVVGICVLRMIWIFVVPYINPTILGVLASYPFSWIVTSVLFIVYYFKGDIYNEKRKPRIA